MEHVSAAARLVAYGDTVMCEGSGRWAWCGLSPMKPAKRETPSSGRGLCRGNGLYSGRT